MDKSKKVVVIKVETAANIPEELHDSVVTLDADRWSILSELLNGSDKPDTAPQIAGSHELNQNVLLISSPSVKLHRGMETGSINTSNFEQEQLKTVITYLQTHIHEILSLEDIAYAAHMSVSRLSSLFNKYYKCGPITYFNSLKIQEARHMIRETSLNFTQISECLGLCSVHYFSKLFKKVTGMTPTEYSRRSH
ncbi:MAG: helix-turn-helix transcriptional regulator [Clostridia bacterium]|nr:helix-turn-helix transcriptional regulator [Clostridia bacterium]